MQAEYKGSLGSMSHKHPKQNSFGTAMLNMHFVQSAAEETQGCSDIHKMEESQDFKQKVPSTNFLILIRMIHTYIYIYV